MDEEMKTISRNPTSGRKDRGGAEKPEENKDQKSAVSLMLVPVEAILPNPEQPRQAFDADAMASLEESIRTHGVLQPISLRGPYAEHFYLIDGERRWRAATKAGLSVIPAQVFDPEQIESPTDEVNIEMALIGNLQRQDMSVSEEAVAFRKLRDRCGYSTEMISKAVGLSLATVYARLMIADLEAELYPYFDAKKLPVDYASLQIFSDMPSEMRLKLLPDLARKNASRPTIMRVCKSAKDGMLKERGRPATRPASSKSMSFTQEPSVKMLTLAQKEQKLPGWSIIEEAAKETCKHCSLNDMGESACRDCPAVELLKRVANKVNTGGGK